MNAGMRKLPMTEDVYQMFSEILRNRPTDLAEIMVDGYMGFFRDRKGMLEVRCTGNTASTTRLKDTMRSTAL